MEGWRHRRQRFAGAFYLLAALLYAVSACAQVETAPLERRIKAAYLFKFASYVEWPAAAFADAAASIRIVVAGDDELAAELTQIALGRTIEDRAVTVRKARDPEAAADAHMLFVSRAEFERLPQFARATRGKPVVIVTESAGALSQGSVINFTLVDQHVRFEIALDEAERRNLKLSSRLLVVAWNVKKAAP